MSIWDAVGSIGGALLGAGASIYGAETAADAAKKAGNFQWKQYLQSREDYEPWRQTGVAALSDLRDIILGGNMDKFKTTPGYEFRMAEGTKAIDRSAASRGNLMSGSTLKALDRYGQGIASDEYQNYINRLNNLAGYGQSATQDTARLGAGAAAGYGDAVANAGFLRGSGYAGAGNAITGGIENYYGMNMLRKYLDTMQS